MLILQFGKKQVPQLQILTKFRYCFREYGDHISASQVSGDRTIHSAAIGTRFEFEPTILL